ncbi:hypothetical protein HYV81_01265 [Candidatus Woesearchaeota archaeon]|nr:hypothetical protein [Candidatus Woesearchaeota archaeon]
MVVATLLSFLAIADANPPKVSNVQVAVTANSSTITWDTDEPGTSTILYGKSIDVELSKFFPSFVTQHAVTLEFLAFKTLYYFKVSSCDQANNCNTTPVANFTTLSLPAPGKVAEVTNTVTSRKQVVINWTALEDQFLKGYRVYRNDVAIANTTRVFYVDNDVKPATAYSYQVAAFNPANDEGEKSDPLNLETPEADIAAPVMTTPRLLVLTPTLAKINWETNEAANATVRYGNATVALAENRKTFLSNHTIELKNLRAGTLISFTAISCDDSGNCAQKTGQFVPGSDVLPPFINVSLPRYFNQQIIRVAGLTESFSEVSWRLFFWR